jgi:hypothetical protein
MQGSAFHLYVPAHVRPEVACRLHSGLHSGITRVLYALDQAPQWSTGAYCWLNALCCIAGTAEGTAWTSGQSEYDPWGHQTTISTNHLQAYAHQLSQCNSITSESETQPPSSGQANRHLSVPNTNLAVQDFAVVLLSADSAALALYQGGRMAQHKVLTGYTTR